MNKTYLTVAQVFAIIGGIIYCLMFFLIFPLILAFFNFRAAAIMDKAKNGMASRDQVRSYGIYLLFTTYVIGGIFAIIAAESKVGTDAPLVQSTEQKLQELESLYEKGMISKEEYEIRRKRIIEAL